MLKLRNFKCSKSLQNKVKFRKIFWEGMPPDPQAWHRPFGARSFASPSRKKILGGPALPNFSLGSGWRVPSLVQCGTTLIVSIVALSNYVCYFGIVMGPTKHRKELQGAFKPSKCLKTLQGTTRYFYSCYKVVENSTRNYKVLLNQVQSSWKHYKELQGTFKPTTR